MKSVAFDVLPAPAELARDVECFRLAQHAGGQALAINVCPNGLPGFTFQHQADDSALESITTRHGRVPLVPILFLYGQITEPSLMSFKPGPYTTLQMLLKPHALRLITNENASLLTNSFRLPSQLGAQNLESQLLQAKEENEQIQLLAKFVSSKINNSRLKRDELIEQSLEFIQENIGSITVEKLLEHSGISERQLQRRFRENVGVSPQWYIRVRRFNKAMELMSTGHYERLADVAYKLNFHDQSHFIRDIKAFSGITPTGLTQKVEEFFHDQVGTSFL